MSQKAIKITGWILSIALAFFFGMTAILKLIGNEKILAQMAAIGIDTSTTHILAVIEIISIVLLLYLAPEL